MKSFPAPDGPELPAKDTGRVPGLLHYADNSVMMTKAPETAAREDRIGGTCGGPFPAGRRKVPNTKPVRDESVFWKDAFTFAADFKNPEEWAAARGGDT